MDKHARKVGCRRGVPDEQTHKIVAWQKGLMEAGRGGACVPARVALQGRIYW
ncbi:MAG: hypothetical protein ACFNLP_06975 [Segatella oulorum]